MENWVLRITLNSDFCTATGASAPGIVNCKTALQDGVPYVPAKRIKGSLMESARELLDHGLLEEEMIHRLFGERGEREGILRIGEGRLAAFPAAILGKKKNMLLPISDYESWMWFLRTDGAAYGITPEFLEKTLTRVRAATAIDPETGVAEEHSLRTMQIVPKGIVFEAKITGISAEEEAAALALCAKGLRHMGSCITRGLGEVECELSRCGEKESQNEASVKGRARSSGIWQTGNTERMDRILRELERCSAERGVRIVYRIQLQSPLAVTNERGGCAEQIPGRAIRGALAGMYLRYYASGSKAHEEERFRRIFLRDGVRFGDAFFWKEGVRYVPCPQALALEKGKEENWFVVWEETEKRRRKIGKPIAFCGGTLQIAAPEKEIHFHHARPADRGIGHALNDRAEDPKGETGQFFSYEALAAGQCFEGEWQGSAEDILCLLRCLQKEGSRLFLGRSRTAEYGECRMVPVEMKLAEQGQEMGQKIKKEVLQNKSRTRESVQGRTEETEREWLVWLITPYVHRNPDNGFYEADAHAFLEEIKGTFAPVKGQDERKDAQEAEFPGRVQLSCSEVVLGGYNSRKRMPETACPALAAGSAFRIMLNGTVRSEQLEQRAWGEMTGIGCGQVRAVLWEEIKRGGVCGSRKQEQH